jgi:DNA-binding PadR family transcriptional regulator
MSQRATESKQLSGLRGVLLAVLVGEDGQPLGGYRLATLIERRLGPAWGGSRQSVYKALEQLEKDGLVSSATTEPPGRRRRVFAPQDGAEAAVASWMESASREPARVDLRAKIGVSRAQDAPRLLRALDAYERECFEALRRTSEAEVQMGSWAGLAINLTRSAVDESLQAELRWVTLARRWIEEFVAQTPSPPAR